MTADDNNGLNAIDRTPFYYNRDNKSRSKLFAFLHELFSFPQNL